MRVKRLGFVSLAATVVMLTAPRPAAAGTMETTPEGELIANGRFARGLESWVIQSMTVAGGWFPGVPAPQGEITRSILTRLPIEVDPACGPFAQADFFGPDEVTLTQGFVVPSDGLLQVSFKLAVTSYAEAGDPDGTRVALLAADGSVVAVFFDGVDPERAVPRLPTSYFFELPVGAGAYRLEVRARADQFANTTVFDEASARLIPEPTTFALLGVGAAVLAFGAAAGGRPRRAAVAGGRGFAGRVRRVRSRP